MDESINLPPGFRFHPTDEEIITHYLSPKILNQNFTTIPIGEIDLNKCEPWDLPSKARMGEKEWYFFCQRDRKYPTGMRTNRATEAGYWKATGKDKEIFKGKNNTKVLIGMKKTLVFYTGRAPKGVKSNWVMHEFRLEGTSAEANFPKPAKDEWVVSRVFHKSNGAKKSPISDYFGSGSLPTLMDPTPFVNNEDLINNFDMMNSSCFYNVPGLDDAQNFNQNYQQMGQVNGSTSNYNYLHHNPMMKMEQFPKRSMVSDDTGLSTDRNTEISSVVSGHEIKNEFEMPTVGSVLDLENMWKF